MIGTCKLCEKENELMRSHIIPKFVFRWMQETGGRYFRTPLKPNVRIQDGYKELLLCKNCEESFSISEKWFAENIFHPHLISQNNIFPYTNELARFIISVLWRVLLTENLDGKEKQNMQLKEVLLDWKDFLLNNKNSTKFDSIHMVFLPDSWGSTIKPNKYISRYFSRVSDGGIIVSENVCIVFAKFARFFLFAETEKSFTNFRGTEISLTSGYTSPNQFIVNENISRFFIDRASEVYKFMECNTSEKQLNKIKNEIISTHDDLVKTDLWLKTKDDLESEINLSGYHYVFNYNCDCCNKLIEDSEGYLFRTYEVVKSIEFWKLLFSINNIGIDEEGLALRIEYFKQISSDTSPWAFCNNCSSKLDLELDENKNFMYEWIKNKGNFYPPQSDDIRKYIKDKEFDELAIAIVTI